jgi:hypothetical protein
MKTGAALVAGLVAILLVSGAVTVWATSARPRSAMPAAWTAEPSAATSAPQHATVPVATGNRGTASPTTSTPTRTTTSGSATTTIATSKQASTASKTTTSSSTLTCSGGQIVSNAFSVKIPAGWMCWDERTSTDGKVVLNSTGGLDVIQITVTQLTDPVAACRAYLAQQGTTLVLLPDTRWGGKTATTANVVMGALTAQVRCAESKGVVYMMAGAPEGGTLDTVVAGMNAMGTAWVWK